MNGVLKKITERIGKLNIQPGPKPNNDIPKTELEKSDSEVISQVWFWPRVGQWLQPNDIVITETGTANFGIWETRFPEEVTAIAQVLWGSIGYATGACQGVALAAQELEKEGKEHRTILFTGDGSFQLTAQELSTMIRRKLKPIIFVICNDGYEIERQIHDSEEVVSTQIHIHLRDHTDERILGLQLRTELALQATARSLRSREGQLRHVHGEDEERARRPFQERKVLQCSSPTGRFKALITYHNS